MFTFHLFRISFSFVLRLIVLSCISIIIFQLPSHCISSYTFCPFLSLWFFSFPILCSLSIVVFVIAFLSIPLVVSFISILLYYLSITFSYTFFSVSFSLNFPVSKFMFLFHQPFIFALLIPVRFSFCS